MTSIATTLVDYGRQLLGESEYEVVPLELDRDFDGIDRLLTIEEWPFTRADLEVSHAQPRSVAYVARNDYQVFGFFAAHHFGDVGYLDMMVVDRHARVSDVARRLYKRVVDAMKSSGIRAFVAHSTNDSFRVFQFLRFQKGKSFTLLARDPLANISHDGRMIENQRLGRSDIDELIQLDAAVFGIERREWIDALLSQPTATFYGRRDHTGKLTASLCLRDRKEGAVCLDAANAADDAELRPLIEDVVNAHATRRLECFVRDGSSLHEQLTSLGFCVPDFFGEIGPLVEWRKGTVGPIDHTDRTQCLSWF